MANKNRVFVACVVNLLCIARLSAIHETREKHLKAIETAITAKNADQLRVLLAHIHLSKEEIKALLNLTHNAWAGVDESKASRFSNEKMSNIVAGGIFSILGCCLTIDVSKHFNEIIDQLFERDLERRKNKQSLHKSCFYLAGKSLLLIGVGKLAGHYFAEGLSREEPVITSQKLCKIEKLLQDLKKENGAESLAQATKTATA